jgi:hypothetical protein
MPKNSPPSFAINRNMPLFTSVGLFLQRVQDGLSNPFLTRFTALPYPLFLWATLWITMFTTGQIGACIDFAQGALKSIIPWPRMLRRDTMNKKWTPSCVHFFAAYPRQSVADMRVYGPTAGLGRA